MYIYIYILYIYNANTEKEQVGVLKGLTTTLSNFKNVDNHTVIFAGDFHMFVDASLDAKVGTPNLKSWSINKLTELNETLDLCDIWRIWNHEKLKYTFSQKYISGIINQRLDYIFSSQNFKKYIKKSDVFNVLLTDHSLVFSSISKRNEFQKDKGKGLWKFNFLSFKFNKLSNF